MFSEYCTEKFTMEVVEVVNQGNSGKTSTYPDISNQYLDVNIDYINGTIGVKLSTEEIVNLLARMQLHAIIIDNGKKIKVEVPATRPDILHPCDIMEDVAIAYNFNKIKKTLPQLITIGIQQPLNKFTDLLRQEIAMAGYTEVLTFGLCSKEENFNFLNRDNNGSAVVVANPKTLEFEVARTSLFPGLFKTVAHNKKVVLPIKVFEISDVVLLDKAKDVGARNERHLAVVYYNATGSGFEIVHGLLDRVMQVLQVPWTNDNDKGYKIIPSNDPTFFEGRRADIICKGKKVGVFGVVHPDVLQAFGCDCPSTALEINIEAFL